MQQVDMIRQCYVLKIQIIHNNKVKLYECNRQLRIVCYRANGSV